MKGIVNVSGAEIDGPCDELKVETLTKNANVTVLGEVKVPGSYPLNNGRMTLLEALGAAGDLTQYGRRDNILITRENNGKLEFELIFEENRNINYKNIENIAREFSDDKFNFKICLRDKECKCLQIADYLAGTLFVALEESKIDKQIDESYINKLIGKFYHYDDREFANIAPLHAYRLSEGPYKHRIHLSLTHLMGKFENKKQGWAKYIQECF